MQKKAEDRRTIKKPSTGKRDEEQPKRTQGQPVAITLSLKATDAQALPNRKANSEGRKHK
jgi:hypothetical protein